MGNIVRIVSVLQVILEVRRVKKTNQDNVLRSVNRCIACAVFQILSGKPGRFLKLKRSWDFLYILLTKQK